VTLVRTEEIVVVWEWSFLEAFQPLGRELSPILEKKLEDATVREISQRLIDTRAADFQQGLIENYVTIQKSFPFPIHCNPTQERFMRALKCWKWPKPFMIADDEESRGLQ